MKAKKHLGQHFLTSEKAVFDMVTSANVQKGDNVLEIGPGKGVLTRALLDTHAKVFAVEKDPDMVDILKDIFASELESDRLTLIRGDVLDWDTNIGSVERMQFQADRENNLSQPIPAGENYFTEVQQKSAPLYRPYKVVANIPYYITGEIIQKFLGSKHKPVSITLLVQKEVAKRIVDTEESVLSLSVKYFGEPTYVSTVKAGSFNPPPKVDSAIITIKSHKVGQKVDKETFFKVVKGGFAHKRKKLLSNLSEIFEKEEVVEAFEKLDLDQNTRAQNVTFPQWLELSWLLK